MRDAGHPRFMIVPSNRTDMKLQVAELLNLARGLGLCKRPKIKPYHSMGPVTPSTAVAVGVKKTKPQTGFEPHSGVDASLTRKADLKQCINNVVDKQRFYPVPFGLHPILPIDPNDRWVYTQLCEGTKLTDEALQLYRSINMDLALGGYPPITAYIVTKCNSVYAYMHLPWTSDFKPHSGVDNGNISHAGLGSVTTAQQLTFADSEPGYDYRVSASSDAMRESRDETIAPIASYLERGILLRNYTWPIGNNFAEDLNPWTELLTNSRISNRISSYNLLNSKLCVKFVISGTGFHFGRIMASYMPLHTYDDLSGYSSLIPQNLIQQSQLPKVFLNPTTCEGGTLCLPFMYHEDYLSITASDWENMGNIQLRSMGNLLHANGGLEGVTISVFAWLEQPKVSVPTSLLAGDITPQGGFGSTDVGGGSSDGFFPQSGKEIDEANHNGMISGPATKIANIASKMTGVPYIGEMASATAMVAGGVAKTAKLMGYSRPTQTKNVEPYKPESVSSLALTTVPDRSAKLTMDDKQELTIDPSIAGIGSEDPLDILSIARRESYLTSFLWEVNNPVNTLLYEMKVQPALWDVSGPTNDIIHMTSLCFASLPFQYWTGDIKIRFQIVCSAHHRGRLLVVLDPNYIRADPNDALATNYTRVVDLAHTQDFTVTVNNSQSTTLLQHFQPGLEVVSELFNGNDGTTLPSPFLFKTKYRTNGVLGLFVQNELAVPSTLVNNDVRVNVFVSAGDNFQVFDPDDYIKNLEHIDLGFDAQSGQEEVNTAAVGGDETNRPVHSESISMNDTYNPPSLNEVYVGEAIRSFRPLIKRFTRWYTLNGNTGIGGQIGKSGAILRMRGRFPLFPALKGDYPDAMDAAFGAVNARYTYTNMTFFQYVICAFQGHRGSVKYKFIPHISNADSHYLTVERDNNSDLKSTFHRENPQIPWGQSTEFSELARERMWKREVGDASENLTGLSGATLTKGEVNTCTEVSLPYISQQRFWPGKRLNWLKPDYERYGYEPRMNYEWLYGYKCENQEIGGTIDVRPTFLDVYVAAADDYQTYFFSGCPPMKYSPTPPSL